MEACLHFRGAALNASEAGISRATKGDCPLCTAVAKAVILPLWGPRGIDQLESFGFWRRKFCIKNAEIFAVGKIAEFAKFAGGKRRKSPDRYLFYRAERALTVKRIGVLLECSEAERKQNDNLLIPYAHQGKSSDNLLDRSLDRALMHF